MILPLISGNKLSSSDQSQNRCKGTQLSKILFVYSDFTVHLVGKSNPNPESSNDISFQVFCSIASLLGDFLKKLEISYVVSILSFKNSTFFTISPTATFKVCPKQFVKNTSGFSDRILLENLFFNTHILCTILRRPSKDNGELKEMFLGVANALIMG